MTRTRRGAAAGAFAAAVWMAAEPALQRAFATPYSDAQLAAGFVTRGPLRPFVGVVAHCSAGALFGVVFVRAGGRGWRRGVAAALVENAVLWPGLAIVDRVHPDVLDGTWPPLLRDRRAFGAATCGHALFGAVLGALTPGDQPSCPDVSRGSPPGCHLAFPRVAVNACRALLQARAQPAASRMGSPEGTEPCAFRPASRERAG